MQAKLWSLNALAVELGRDRRTLARLLEGLPPDSESQEKGGRVSRRWRMSRVVDHLLALERGSGSDDELDLERERARLAAAQADKIELELAIKRREVAYLPHVAAVWGRLLSAARAALLALPTAVGARIANASDRARAFEFLETRVHEILSELADGNFTDIAPTEEPTAHELP